MVSSSQGFCFSMPTSLMLGVEEIDTWQVLVSGELGVVLKDLHM